MTITGTQEDFLVEELETLKTTKRLLWLSLQTREHDHVRLSQAIKPVGTRDHVPVNCKTGSEYLDYGGKGKCLKIVGMQKD